jgi:hypothetical protein
LLFEFEDIYSRSRSEFIADSLINNAVHYKQIFDNEINYWIIDNSNDILLGPFQEIEYLHKKNDLKIPEELKIK